jgi:uncharacterized protein with PIN domain
MRRTEEGYRARFHRLLADRRPDSGRLAERLVRWAADRAARGHREPLRALHDLYLEVLARTGKKATPSKTLRFVCDGSLGALARWLRALGYEADWSAASRGLSLVGDADRSGSVLLTSDARVFEFGTVRDGVVAALWIPSGLSVDEQLALVAADIGLVRAAPRCMSCGGPLRPVAKADVAGRIPPRTARWKDEYFLCSACDRLFWQGTHWERIERRLTRALE